MYGRQYINSFRNLGCLCLKSSQIFSQVTFILILHTFLAYFLSDNNSAQKPTFFAIIIYRNKIALNISIFSLTLLMVEKVGKWAKVSDNKSKPLRPKGLRVWYLVEFCPKSIFKSGQKPKKVGKKCQTIIRRPKINVTKLPKKWAKSVRQ